jgi:hypothetical protein
MIGAVDIGGTGRLADFSTTCRPPATQVPPWHIVSTLFVSGSCRRYCSKGKLLIGRQLHHEGQF